MASLKISGGIFFINVPFSMAKKHQLYLANKITDIGDKYQQNFVKGGDIIKEGFSLTVQTSVWNWQEIIEIQENDGIYETEEVTTDGLTYMSGAIVILKMTNQFQVSCAVTSHWL